MGKPTVSSVGLVVMARQPVAGFTKTRLVGELSAEEVAAFYAAMLADRCQQVAELATLRPVVPAVAMANCPDSEGSVADLVPPDFRVIEGMGGEIGADLLAATRSFLDKGMPVVVVDSDSPTLPMNYITAAVDLLVDEGTDVVIGPAEDGGYYLLGLTSDQPDLFANMPWSSSGIFAATVDRAHQLGLRIHELPIWWDVDHPADRERLQRILLESWWPTQTAEWLRRHRGEHSPGADAPDVNADKLWTQPWPTLDRRRIYSSRYLSLREDQVALPSGDTTAYNVVEMGECVGILPFATASSVLMVRQYRYVAGRPTWEIPTGGADFGEEPRAAARRELAEEARVSAGRLVELGRFDSSKSMLDETAHLYAAYDLSPTEGVPDDTEFIRVEQLPFAQVLEMVLAGEITDAMTIIAVLWAARDRA